MKVTIFGTGYVGLVTGACLADVGYHVICVDIDERKIEELTAGRIPIFEPGLDAIVQRASKSGHLVFSTSAEEGIKHGEFIFIAVGTPPDEDGSADLKYVLEVAKSIGQYMNNNKVIIDKSTVPVGTAEKVSKTIQLELDAKNQQHSFDVVSNPEFLKEGDAIQDFMRPDRIIVGTDNEKVTERMRSFYAPFNRIRDKLIIMDVRSAEMAKYVANSMLATKISFMNEMSNIAEKVGANIESIRYGIGSDPRIGTHFIYAGPGYGGSCFPKDVNALIKTSEEYGYETRILKSVEAVNYDQKRLTFKKIDNHFGSDLKGKTIALWGLSFKPNTDDMRDAPSRVLMEALWDAGCTVQAHDPEAIDESKRIYGDRPDLVYCESLEEALRNADALVLMTEWKVYWRPDFTEVKQAMSGNVIFDARNIYEQHEVEAAGFEYYAIGRGKV